MSPTRTGPGTDYQSFPRVSGDEPVAYAAQEGAN